MTRRFDLWLPGYALGSLARLRARLKRRRRKTHVLFLVCDHFEPRHGAVAAEQPQARVRHWQQAYAAFQGRCREAFGTTPVHTFFYPPHHGYEHLPRLAQMAFEGLGEIELHYHHQGDTDESLRREMSAAIQEYQRWGLLLESGEPPRTAFGFVHGDWALNNSCGGEYCGVNDEVSILRDLGCWGDFTMPSGNECQTRKINSIYYGVGDAARPKAHDSGPDARVGGGTPPGLFMMQGPLAINWHAPDHPRPENASLTSRNWGRPDRLPVWLDCNVHVKGRPDWLFIKLHTHGAIERDFDALFGDKAFAMHRALHEQFNDGKRFQLHYVTARQAYNVAKAAEDGKSGDPSEWLDHYIQPPATRYYALAARHQVVACTSSHLALRDIEAGEPVQLQCRVGAVTMIGGRLRVVDLDVAAGLLRLETHGETNTVEVAFASPAPRVELSGAALVTQTPTGQGVVLLISLARSCAISWRIAAAADRGDATASVALAPRER